MMVLVALTGCEGGKPTLASGAVKVDDASLVARAPTPEGPRLRLAYHGCPALGVAEVGGEVFVHYVAPGIARIERLGPQGVPTATFDLHVGVPERPSPETPPVRDASGQYPSLPLERTLDLAGPAPDDLYLAVLFHFYGSAKRSRVYHYEEGRWTPTAVAGMTDLFPWGSDAVLAFGRAGSDRSDPEFIRLPEDPTEPAYFEPLLEHAARAGAGPGAAEPVVGRLGVQVLAVDVPRSGPILATTKHQLDPPGPNDRPVGTWLMVWDAARRIEAVVRLTETVAERAEVVADGEGGAYANIDDSLFHWRPKTGATLVELPPSLVGGRFRLAEVDERRRPWAWRESFVARLDADWVEESLPGASPIRALAGVRSGKPWALRADDTLWSRGSDGVWLQSPVPEDQAGGSSTSPLFVTAAGEPWLIRDHWATGPQRVQPSQSSAVESDLYTLRPIEHPNPCRSTAAE